MSAWLVTRLPRQLLPALLAERALPSGGFHPTHAGRDSPQQRSWDALTRHIDDREVAEALFRYLRPIVRLNEWRKHYAELAGSEHGRTVLAAHKRGRILRSIANEFEANPPATVAAANDRYHVLWKTAVESPHMRALGLSDEPPAMAFGRLKTIEEVVFELRLYDVRVSSMSRNEAHEAHGLAGFGEHAWGARNARVNQRTDATTTAHEVDHVLRGEAGYRDEVKSARDVAHNLLMEVLAFASGDAVRDSEQVLATFRSPERLRAFARGILADYEASDCFRVPIPGTQNDAVELVVERLTALTSHPVAGADCAAAIMANPAGTRLLGDFDEAHGTENLIALLNIMPLVEIIDWCQTTGTGWMRARVDRGWTRETFLSMRELMRAHDFDIQLLLDGPLEQIRELPRLLVASRCRRRRVRRSLARHACRPDRRI